METPSAERQFVSLNRYEAMRSKEALGHLLEPGQVEAVDSMSDV